MSFTPDQLRIARKRGFIIYDYIDAIDQKVSSAPLTEKRKAIHKSLLERQGDTICLASASALYDDAALYRKKDLVLVENGVDSDHFKVERSKDGLDRKLLEILKKGHPIAGYFGALADWLDYDLIRATAGQLPDVEFVLIGIDYDGSIKARQSPERTK